MIDTNKAIDYLFAIFPLLLLTACASIDVTPTAVAIVQATLSPSLTTTVRSSSARTPTALPSPSHTRPATATPLAPSIPTAAPSSLTPTPTLELTAAAQAEIPVRGEVTFELAAQTGGSLRSMALAGHTIFAGQGPRLIALDASNAAEPRKLGESTLLPGLVNSVIVQEGTAYITAGKYLLLLNVSDPGNMMVQSQIELHGPGTVIVRGSTIYAGGEVGTPNTTLDNTPQSDGYVATIQLSDKLHVLDSIMFPNSIITLALSRNTLFVSSDSGAIWHADVSNPLEIGEPAQVNVGQAFSIRAYGNLLLLGGTNEMRAYDITNIDDPQPLWAKDDANLGQVYDFAVHGNHIYTIGLLATGGIVPISDTIEIVEPLANPDYLYAPSKMGILAERNHLYLIDSQSLSIYYATGTEQFQYIGSYIPATGGSLAISNSDLFVAYNAGSRLGVGLQGYIDRYTLPELTLETHHTFHAFGQGAPEPAHTVTWANSRLYIMQDTQIAILDADSFTSIGTIDAQNELILPPQTQALGSIALPVVDNLAYLYGTIPGGEAGVMRFDATNSAQPVRLDVIKFQDQNLRIAGIAASERWLVVSLYNVLGEQGQDLLLVYDVTGEVPQLMTEMELDQELSEMEISGDLLLAGGGGAVAETDDFLELYSLSDATPIETLSISHIYEIHVVNDLVYITTWHENALLIYDISHPTNPRVVGIFELPDARALIAVSHDYIVVGNEEMGIFVFRIGHDA